VSTRFGRYDLLRPIGKGGMAEVFLARYVGPEGFEKQLVIKRVLPQISERQSLLRMFFEEAKTQVSLSHGNLVSVFDFGRVDNDYFIAMDYVRGADVASLFAAERAADRQLAPPLLAHVGVEICRALAYVHARGFVHRDVTPRNVLVSVDGEVKLSDFGLALSLASPLASGRPGTPSYMAPEQARGERADARADIYSLGLILAEGLLGRGPRANRDPQDGVDGTLAADLAKHATLSPILARAIAAAPGDRFAGAEEMLTALEQELARTGAAREALVRELAAKVRLLAPGDEVSSPASPRAATLPTAAGDAGPTRESYFRDDQSQHFVESMLEAVPASAPPRAGVAKRIAALVAGAAIVTAGAFALRGSGAAEGERSPAVPPPAVARAPDHGALAHGSQSAAELAATERQAPSPAAPPPSPAAAPTRAPSPARGQPRAPAPAAATGHIRILCTPWCVPFVDGKPAGEGGRSFVVPVPAGRHRVEARRLDDHLQRQLDVAPGQEESTQFDFDEAPR
jgi:eukaryotic-like serine/threonine-protein kinase